MPTKTDRLPARIRNATLAVLPRPIRVQVQRPDEGQFPFEVIVATPGAHHRFLATWAGEGWPADVEQAVRSLPGIQVVYASRLSEGAREWLSQREIGWIDEARAANVNLPSGLILWRDPLQPPARLSRDEGWTRALLATAEALLAGVSPRVNAVEGATGLSRGAVVGTLKRLERLGFLEQRGAARGPNALRELTDVDGFVDNYTLAAAELRSKQKAVRIHRLWRDPLGALTEQIGPSLASAGVEWAVTGAAASSFLAPYLSDLTVVSLYVDRDTLSAPRRLAEVLDGKVVEKGHRIEVRELPTPVSALGPVIDGVQVALPARVYADLMAEGGRFAEAAHHLREVRGVGPPS